MTSIIIEQDDVIYVDYEAILTALIDRLDSMSLDLMVSEVTDEARGRLTALLCGYAMSIRHLAVEYMDHAPEDRQIAWTQMVRKLDAITMLGGL